MDDAAAELYVRHSMDRTGACEGNVMSEQKWPPLKAVFYARTLVHQQHQQHHEPTNPRTHEKILGRDSYVNDVAAQYLGAQGGS